MKFTQSLLLCLFCLNVIFLEAQSYSDGAIQLQLKVREVKVNHSDNDGLLITDLDAEFRMKLWAKDNADLDGASWINLGGTLSQNNMGFPSTTNDFNTLIFDHSYSSSQSPKYLDLRMDAWEDDCPSDMNPPLSLECSTSENEYDGGCCIVGTNCNPWSFPGNLLGCTSYDSDDERCNANPFVTGLDYRLGTPCQWYDHGFQSNINSCIGNKYEPRVESFWRYTKGTSCVDAINLGTVAGTETHYNSNECYSNNHATSPGNDVTYKFSISESSKILIKTTGATFNTHLYLLDNSCAQVQSNTGVANDSEIEKVLCPGDYYVVVDGNGAGAMGLFTLSIEKKESLADFSFTEYHPVNFLTPSGCLHYEVSFIDGSQNATSWNWDFGDGHTSNLQNPTHVYEETGTYTVSLTVMDNAGCMDMESKIDYVFVTGPTVDFSVDVTEGCPNLEVSFTDLTSHDNPPTFYEWRFGDGTTSNMFVGPMHTYTSYDQFDVSLRVIDNLGCDFTLEKTQYISTDDSTLPEASCKNHTVQLNSNGEVSITENDLDDNSTDNCSIQSLALDSYDFTCDDLGGNTVTLTVTDQNGNEKDCISVVTVEDDIKPNFNNTCANYPTPYSTVADQCYASMTFTVPNPTDNCGVTELKAKIWDSKGTVVQNWTTNPDGQFAPDTYQIKWRAKDAAGNKKVCTKTFSVTDSQDPDAQCVASHVVQLSGGVGSITTVDIDAGSSDNCNYSLSLSKTNFDCNDRGNQTVTMTATDDAGNSHQCTTDLEIKGTTLTINDVTQNEGNGPGFTFFFFKIERADNGCTEQVDYETIDGDATIADNDYVFISGTTYYPPGGSNTRYVICRGKKDSKYESDEDFWVEMRNPTTGVSFTKDKGEGMLMNDDVAPFIGDTGDITTSFNVLEGKAKLFPNPVIRYLNISIPNHWLETEAVDIQLQDAFGKTLSAFKLPENTTVVDVTGLVGGVYQLVFISKSGRRLTEQFVKVD